MNEYVSSRLGSNAVREGMPSPSSIVEPRYLLKALWRRKWLIAITVVGATLLAAVATQSVSPRYTAMLKLAFEKAQQFGDFTGTVAQARQDEANVLAGILTEIEILESHELAEKVINKLHLDENPEFNPALTQGCCQQLTAALSRIFPAWLAPLKKESASKQPSEIIAQFFNHLDVNLIPHSNVFNVRFTSKDPALAAEVLNTLGDAYLISRYEDRLENTRRASEWLAANEQKLRDKVKQAEKNAEKYRQEHNLFQGEKTSLITAQISDLNLKLIEASAERTALESNAMQARQLVGKTDDLAALDQVLHSELIQRFRAEQLGLERREAEMKEQYGARHPLIIQLAAEKQRLKDTIDSEVKKILRSLETRAQVARMREAALAKDLNALKQQGAEADTASIALRELEREAEANRLLLEKFMTAFIETSAREDARSAAAYARIISRPMIPDKPSFPKPTMIVALAFLAGIIISLALALGIEALDAGYRSAHQIEHDLDLPVLAHVPAMGGWLHQRQQRKELPSHVINHPASIFSEAIRSIYTKLLTSSSGLPRSVVITSSKSNEGKTTTALSLTRMLANTGRNVLLIDGDLRLPQVAEVLQLSTKPGLVELLSGTAQLEDVIQCDPDTPADVIVCGHSLLNASDLLTKPIFAEVLQRLEKRYEAIIIDAPPVMAVTDALALANVAAATIMVVKWGSTRREVVKYAAMQLARVSKRFEGIILTKIHLKSNARYGYGDSAQYSAKMKKYYRLESERV